MTDNIKAFPGASGLPENPLTLAPRPVHYCGHRSIVIDQHTRTIQCSDLKCGATLDPFDYLRTNAESIATAWRNHRHVSNEVIAIAELVTQLKKQEQRLRAMVKRLQEKTGAVINVRGEK